MSYFTHPTPIPAYNCQCHEDVITKENLIEYIQGLHVYQVPSFAVRETFSVKADCEVAPHFHFYVETTLKDSRQRQKLNNLKHHNYRNCSYKKRIPDEADIHGLMRYYCKGKGPDDPPEVIHNTILTEQEIKDYHKSFWMIKYDLQKEKFALQKKYNFKNKASIKRIIEEMEITDEDSLTKTVHNVIEYMYQHQVVLPKSDELAQVVKTIYFIIAPYNSGLYHNRKQNLVDEVLAKLPPS